MSKIYSPSEVSLHTSKTDCWLIIHGKRIIQEGRMLSSMLQDVGHSSSATSMMESYLIGSIEGYVKADKAPAAQNSTQKAAAAAAASPSSSSFLDFLLPLIVLAFAFAAWYYLTFQAKAKTGHQDL
ncbi:Cytochrome B5 isoform D [Ananas comosus]|uniref:Cytochrome B5 isoform D n=1 Tax=Ananas comosus TaxID=4615 RepID=A0A199UGH1_ANACO|nr:Cytochrome B5 isoform D [Ananas comosus]